MCPVVSISHRVIVHVDLDAFFASVEQNDNPEIKGKPVIIGADPLKGKGRGVVSTASYEARKFGIHSAMPISRAYRLCPHGFFLPPRMKRYAEVSRTIMDIFAKFSPNVEPLSIDEAFLDCTGMEYLLGDPHEIGKKIRKKIFEATGLTASVGIAGNKFTAKVASELNKPDGLTVCPSGEEKKFLASLPISHLWGAGPKTAGILKRMGLFTIGDVASADSEMLERNLGKSGIRFQYLAMGMDSRPVIKNIGRKSISKEHTFGEDTDDSSKIEKILYHICEETTASLREEGLYGKTITLKIRLEGFETHTKSKTLDQPFNDTETFRKHILDEFRKYNAKGKKIRLIGAGISSLSESAEVHDVQLELFNNTENPRTLRSGRQISISHEKSSQTDHLLDSLRKQFPNRIKRAVFLDDTHEMKPKNSGK